MLSGKTLTRLILAGALVAVGLIAFKHQSELIWCFQHLPLINRFFRPTVEKQIAKYGEVARSRLLPIFKTRGLAYPPAKVVFLANKDKRELEIYAAAADGRFRYVCTYPILGASGHLGPKLRSGDMQVPEGIYQLTLEPNTPYHVALRLNYPNEYDLARAKEDGRTNPGSDILIHGTEGSIGCIAVGDQGSEDLFVLAYDTQDKNVPLIIAPVDLRSSAPPAGQATDPTWLPDLYKRIKEAMGKFEGPK